MDTWPEGGTGQTGKCKSRWLGTYVPLRFVASYTAKCIETRPGKPSSRRLVPCWVRFGWLSISAASWSSVRIVMSVRLWRHSFWDSIDDDGHGGAKFQGSDLWSRWWRHWLGWRCDGDGGMGREMFFVLLFVEGGGLVWSPFGSDRKITVSALTLSFIWVECSRSKDKRDINSGRTIFPFVAGIHK